MDAGFYDNYGVGVAAGWLNFWGPWLVENTSGVLLIQIRDSASHHDRRHLLRLGEGGDRREGERVKTSAVGWLTGPLAAVDKARQSTSSFRNDDLLAELDEFFKQSRAGKADPQFFETVVFERYSNVGMSWFLNAEDKAQITNSWSGELPKPLTNFNPPSLKLLREWWDKH